MPSESFRFHTRRGPTGAMNRSIQKEKEALTRASDHTRYLKREVENLPPTIGHIIELVCLAVENLIEEERLSLRPPIKSDTDGSLAAQIKASMKQEAVQQLATAVGELDSEGRNFVDTTVQ